MSVVQVERLPPVHRITLDDGKVNAINPRLLAELDEALDQAEADGAAVVIAGRARMFSAGLDLKTLPQLPAAELDKAIEGFGRTMLRIFGFPRPVVAASTGHALAGGCVTLLACDERVQARGPFRIGLNETAIGLPLPRFVVEMAKVQVPVRSLFRVVAAGDSFLPEEAERLGLVDEVLGADEVLARAMERARSLAALPPEAYRANKRALRGHLADANAETLQREMDEFRRFMARLRGS